MMRRLLTVGFAVVLVQALPACVGGGAEPNNLNPQPLPPRETEEDPPPAQESKDNASGSSGSSSGGTAPNFNGDAGPDGGDGGQDQ
jgi:hypothetical protein